MKSLVFHRILIYFLLGIGIPSAVMGYLALRGIKNDQALLEKKRAEQYENFARKIIYSVDEELKNFEGNFQKQVRILNQNKKLTLDRLDQAIDDSDLVVTCFVFKKQDLRLPSTKLLFREKPSDNQVLLL